MRALETRIPPPAVLIVLGGMAWWVAKLLPALSFDMPFRTYIAGVLAFAGLMLNLLPKLAFRSAGTTVNPLQPSAATHLVTEGVYRHTRNPMYLGHSIILLAWGIYLHNVFALLLVPAFVLYVSRFQILPEERLLAERFPADYREFRERTRRWL